jgi:SAM-dependent methyltransferase
VNRDFTEAMRAVTEESDSVEDDGGINLRRQMDAIYGDLSLDEIPWNREEPPELLVALLESKQISPCDAVDLGCGAGNYAVWLASKGFRMTGVDMSPKAIDLADDLASKRGVSCRFLTANLLGDLGQLEQSFDLAYDWEVLHHVFPEDRRTYADNVHRVLRPGGTYLSVCFSREDRAFGGQGTYRKTNLGTTLYFSSEDELRELFEPLFRIQDLRTSEIAGKGGLHMAVVARMSRR